LINLLYDLSEKAFAAPLVAYKFARIIIFAANFVVNVVFCVTRKSVFASS
jgi:hypothetical protein